MLTVWWVGAGEEQSRPMGVGAGRLTVPRAGLHVSVAYAINAADLALWARPRLVLGILFAPATFAP